MLRLSLLEHLRPSHTPEQTMLEQTRKAAHLYTLFVLRIWWLEGKHPDDSLQQLRPVCHHVLVMR
jgi:hypothetical protein